MLVSSRPGSAFSTEEVGMCQHTSRSGLALTLGILGFGSWVVGAVKGAPAHNDLARAVWWYNRGLR